MCISILGIATINFVVFAGGESEEEPLHRLFHTGRVSGSDAMKQRCRARRAIAAITRASGSIMFDGILPMRAKNDSARRLANWLSIHLEVMEVVELFMLTGAPLLPGAEGAQFAPSEASDGLFSRSDGLGLDR